MKRVPEILLLVACAACIVFFACSNGKSDIVDDDSSSSDGGYSPGGSSSSNNGGSAANVSSSSQGQEPAGSSSSSETPSSDSVPIPGENCAYLPIWCGAITFEDVKIASFDTTDIGKGQDRPNCIYATAITQIGNESGGITINLGLGKISKQLVANRFAQALQLPQVQV